MPKDHRIIAKKSLGQNFLRDPKVVSRIIQAGDLQETDIVIEIGPGKGALTKALLPKVEKVFAVEKDDRLIPYLLNKFSDVQNLELIHGDALTYMPKASPYKVIANIPYYITSPLLTHFLLEQWENNTLPTIIVLLIQKEVASKICDPKNESVISLAVKIFGQAKIVCSVHPQAFNPAPKVHSAVIKIEQIHAPVVANPRKFIKFIKHCFLNPRKTILNNLKPLFNKDTEVINLLLESTNISPQTRPEAISYEQWIHLFNTVEAKI